MLPACLPGCPLRAENSRDRTAGNASRRGVGAPQIQALAQGDGPLQLSLFDERDLAEITSPDFPGERLIVCRNRELATERARQREALLVATERELARVQAQFAAKAQAFDPSPRSALRLARS